MATTARRIAIPPPSPAERGVESRIEGSRSRDRPIVPGGPEVILAARGHHHHPRRRPAARVGTMMGWSIPTKTEVMGCNRHHSSSPYRFMVEDYDDNDGGAATPSSAADRYRRLLCVKGGGSSGHPAHTTWAGAFRDGRQELVEHFREHWEGHHGRRRE